MNQARVKFLHYSDRVLSLEFGNKIDVSTHKKVIALKEALEAEKFNFIQQILPTYCSLSIFYDPLLIKSKELLAKIQVYLQGLGELEERNSKVVEIPVCYDEEFSLDMEEVMAYCHLDREKLISLHTEREYLIYMLGFTPGFPYLGGMNPALKMPRKQSPRLKISAGSVGIAGEQTGVYSLTSPGGWQIIGRTPLKLFRPNEKEHFLLKAGDRLIFRAISKEKFWDLAKTEIKSDECQKELKDIPIGLEIIKPGLLATIQDEGRFFYAEYGVTESGAIDHYAYSIANYLVNNQKNAAVIEFAMGNAELYFHRDCQIALTGADCQPTINSLPIEMWQSQKLRAGDVLRLDFAQRGMWVYLAVAGGINCPLVMNSRSTDLKAEIGGLNGRGLQPKDKLAFVPQPMVPKRCLSERYIPDYPMELKLRVILGPQDDFFTADAVEVFFNEIYTVSGDSNRMAYRLDGPLLQAKTTADIISDAIVFGSIQVSNQGQPIIMMAEHQTTGGYAKIATVISADLAKLAQARVGTKVRFEGIKIEEAERLYAKMMEELEQIKIELEEVVTEYQVRVGGHEFALSVKEITNE